MSDFGICMGCGDIPTNELSEECAVRSFKESEEHVQEMKSKGYAKDSTNHWYDSTNYIDQYYADW